MIAIMVHAMARRRPPHRFRGTVRLTLVFGVLLGVNFYFFFVRGGTSLRDLMRPGGILAAHSAAGLVAAAALPASPKPKPTVEEVDEARVVEGVMTDTDTVERVWKRDGLGPRQVNELAQALGKVFDLRMVRAGHSYTLRFDGEDHLRSLDYRVTPALAYHLEAGPAGFIAHKQEKPLQTRVVELGGIIDASLYEAVRRMGEAPALVGWLTDMFAWDLNFYTDTQAGDRFKVIVEKRYLGDKFYKYGRVLAAEYQGRIGCFRAFWFKPDDGTSGGYYTEHGESVVKSLLKTPLKYVRISSGFDRHRFHPILHTERAHLGVDYAAPAGTPVWATAAGKVTFAGRRGGAGNCVIVSHAGAMESIYMHLQRFARGLRPGQGIRQKQVIGYVGMTGLATGPHLHFSLRVGKRFVDPRTQKPMREAPLLPRYRVQFADAIAPRLTALSAIEIRPLSRMMVSGATPPP